MNNLYIMNLAIADFIIGLVKGCERIKEKWSRDFLYHVTGCITWIRVRDTEKDQIIVDDPPFSRDSQDYYIHDNIKIQSQVWLNDWLTSY